MSDTHDHTHANPGTNRTRLAIAFGITATILIAEVIGAWWTNSLALLVDAGHMHRACDILGGQKVKILWGPVRHGPGHNVACYHRDPDGHIVELFYDLDSMTDEALGFWDPRPWHRDRPQRPRVWTGLPRDVWGLPPSPEFLEMFRLQLPEDVT